MLGLWLRRMRDEHGKTQHEVADAVHTEQSTISRLETGWYRTNRQEETVRALLRLYGVSEIEHEKYLTWGYPNQNGPDHTLRLDILTGLEPLTQILQYEQSLIPDVLQIPEYARAALSSGHIDYTEDEIDQMLDERLCAQRILDTADPPHLWTLIENVILYRPLGGSAIWRKQVDHLLEIREHPNVTLQVIADHECGLGCTAPLHLPSIRGEGRGRPDLPAGFGRNQVSPPTARHRALPAVPRVLGIESGALEPDGPVPHSSPPVIGHTARRT